MFLRGDFNKHVGNLLKDNHEKISYGGKLIRHFLASNTLSNASDKIIGGPFTWYNPSKPDDDSLKSCIDLVIVSNDLVKYLDKVTIDKNLDFTPSRPVSKGKLSYTDHYAILIEFKNLPIRSSIESKKKLKIWNLNKENGWENFKQLPDDNRVLRDIASSSRENKSTTQMMKNINNEVTKVKFKAFGKVSTNKGTMSKPGLRTLQKEKQEILKLPYGTEQQNNLKEVNEKIATKIVDVQRENLDQQLKKLKDLGNSKGRSACVFHLRDMVTGKNAMEQEPTTMKDPLTHHWKKEMYLV